MYRSPYRPVVFCQFPYVAVAAGGRPEPSPFLDRPDFWVLPAGDGPPAEAVKIAEIDTGNGRYAVYQAVGGDRASPETRGVPANGREAPDHGQKH